MDSSVLNFWKEDNELARSMWWSDSTKPTLQTWIKSLWRGCDERSEDGTFILCWVNSFTSKRVSPRRLLSSRIGSGNRRWGAFARCCLDFSGTCFGKSRCLVCYSCSRDLRWSDVSWQLRATNDRKAEVVFSSRCRRILALFRRWENALLYSIWGTGVFQASAWFPKANWAFFRLTQYEPPHSW